MASSKEPTCWSRGIANVVRHGRPALFRLGELARVKSAVERFETVTPNAPTVRAAREALAKTKANANPHPRAQ